MEGIVSHKADRIQILQMCEMGFNRETAVPLPTLPTKKRVYCTPQQTLLYALKLRYARLLIPQRIGDDHLGRRPRRQPRCQQAGGEDRHANANERRPGGEEG